MSEDPIRYPAIDQLYHRYLRDEDSAEFIREVASRYTVSSLHRLAANGERATRRAAVMAICFLGSFCDNEVIGRSLIDEDRGVRMLADHGIRQLWTRQGTPAQQQALGRLYRIVSQDRCHEGIELATRLIEINPTLGEAFSQRAIVHSIEGRYDLAVHDCRDALNCNRFHFPAAMGMAHCYLQLKDMSRALNGFRLALRINPDLESVRSQIRQLERATGM